MKIVVIGAGGRLGAALMRAYRDKFEIIGFDHEDLDLEDLADIHETLDALDFDVLINCAAFTNVDLCESQRDRAFLINAEAPLFLAEICVSKGAKLIHFSTDYVFDGTKREPYTEEDPANPISVYGESKRAGELNVLQTNDKHLVLRVSWVFGPERPSFIDAMIKRAREEDHVTAVSDKFSTPTYTKDIAGMLEKLLIHASPARTILHFANTGECSWQEYAQFAIDTCRSLGMPLKAKSVGNMKMSEMKNWVARRPVYSVLAVEKFTALTGAPPRSWRDAVADYIRTTYFKL
jgi:dTDP-4-dehydrorhamnose reductase